MLDKDVAIYPLHYIDIHRLAKILTCSFLILIIECREHSGNTAISAVAVIIMHSCID